jgi:hypothetical protein
LPASTSVKESRGREIDSKNGHDHRGVDLVVEQVDRQRTPQNGRRGRSRDSSAESGSPQDAMNGIRMDRYTLKVGGHEKGVDSLLPSRPACPRP